MKEWRNEGEETERAMPSRSGADRRSRSVLWRYFGNVKEIEIAVSDGRLSGIRLMASDVSLERIRNRFSKLRWRHGEPDRLLSNIDLRLSPLFSFRALQ
ncbi:hypothetical protein CKO51_21040 [Rhodopirellula sp. SM50]|nr:hypothetical protein CKO51_21040 [Rhodopirellula sp. SM50]